MESPELPGNKNRFSSPLISSLAQHVQQRRTLVNSKLSRYKRSI